MNERYYLAVDIGASSGRHILGHTENGKIITEEVYRFENGPVMRNGHLTWDIDRLFEEVVNGMKVCADKGIIPVSMGIDTWGVDYVLLDKDGVRTAPCYSYRDSRTEGMDAEVRKLVSDDELYRKTGIQKAIFNTIYQLTAAKKQEPESLEKAQMLLQIPDYLHFLLTGTALQEYTNATTTQLADPYTKQWNYELIRLLGLPERLFGPLSMPGTKVGRLKESIREKAGFDCDVILPATHDTASAVMSVPAAPSENEAGEEIGDVLYISSGTWSLLGCELPEAELGSRAQAANFTNEGGYGYRFRFLKNIMGLWMIQSVRKELAENENIRLSFAELCGLAEEADIRSLVDADDGRFLAPVSMTREIRKACEESGMAVPGTPGELAKVIYMSLAASYAKAVRELESITGRKYPVINIVGGGSNAGYLNRLTAEKTGKTVIAGPSEATAIGNLGSLMLADKVFADLKDFRHAVFRSLN